MRRRDAFLAIPLLALVAGLAWFAFGRSPPRISIGDGSTEAADDGTAPDALNLERGGALAGGGGSRKRKDTPPEPVAVVPTFSKSEGVFGRVTDAREAPIPGAKLTLERLDPTLSNWWQGAGEAMFTTDSAADGTYLIGPVTAGAFKWRLRAQSAGYARAGFDVPSRGSRIDVHLDRGGTLEVRVKDLTGAPIANAAVRAGDGEPFTRVTGVTDATGKAHLEGLALGGVELNVECLGYAATTASDAVVVAGATAEKSVVLRAAIRVTGKVTEEASGQAIAGATVTSSVGDGEPGSPVATATTDAEGKFALDAPGRAGTNVEVTARKDGLGSSSTWVQLQATAATSNPGTPAGGGSEVLLRLGKSSGITGTVLDADSSPVANSTVVFSGMGGSRGLGESIAHSDTEGRFTLDLPPGTNRDGAYTIAAFAPEKGLGVTTVTPSKTPSVTLRLLGAGSVAGTVKGPDGAGAEGATVQFHIDQNKRADLPTSTSEFNPRLYQQASYDARLVQLSASADAEGRFRVDSVPVGTYLAFVTWKGLSVTTPSSVSIRSGATATIDVTLKAGSVIEGRVIDADAKPIVGAQVGGSDPQNNQPHESRYVQTRSDAEGRFILRGVLGDNWALSVQATGFIDARVASVKAGATDVEVRMTPLGWIDGVVTGPDGKPYSGSFVASAAQSGSDEHERGGASGSFSGADGTFRLRGLAAGAYVVSVTTGEGLVPTFAPPANVVNGAGAGPVEIRLTSGASISGSVSEDGSRRPLTGANVAIRIKGTASSAGRTDSWSTTDAKGRFTALGLAGGTYTLSVTDAAGGSHEEEIQLDLGQSVDREFATRRPGSISVRVVDADGRPVAKARIMLRTEGGTFINPNWDAMRKEGKVDFSRGGWESAMNTNEEGRLTRWHVPPGRIGVTARSRTTPMRHEPVMVEVASDRTTEITITMSADTPGGR